MITLVGGGWWAEARNQRLRKSLWSNEGRIIRGDTHGSKGDYDRAIADFAEAVRLETQRASAYFNRGRAYELKGDIERARSDYEKTKAVAPNSGTAQMADKALKRLGGQ